MRIGELAAQSGFSVETIRFYEAKGLIEPAARTDANYRVYGERHLERLRFIRHCRALDMSLDDVAALVAFDAQKPEDCREAHAMIARHVTAISEKIRELQLLREHLLALALRCPGHADGRPCGILTGLEDDAREGHCSCGIEDAPDAPAETSALKKSALKFERPR